MVAMNGDAQLRRREVPPFDRSLLQRYSPTMARILAARGILDLRQATLELGALPRGDDVPGMDAMVARLVSAIEAQERILIVGDFDADGATGAALAVRGLRLLGASCVDVAVPDRARHGYGLSVLLVDELAERRPQVLVTVDQGTSSVDGVVRATQHGIDVLITDHHLPGERLPPALAIVNPNAGTLAPRYARLAGVGVMFYVLIALRAALAGRGSAPPPLAPLLDLVALGTVADLVPLDHANRILVAEGLRRINAGRTCAGIRALIECAGRDLGKIRARDLGFQIAPRLNAAGRLADMQTGVRCLLSDDIDEARGLAAELSALNHERRSLQREMQTAADAIVDEQLAMASALPAALVVHDEHWHPGVVGLVASRLAERLHRPTIALAPAGEGEWRGSARSIAGFHIRDALAALDTRRPGLMQRFGGHAMAAGLSLAEAGLRELAPAFCGVAAGLLDEQQLQKLILSDGELAGPDLALPLASEIDASGPFGQGFSEPLFDGEFDVVEQRVLKEAHLKLRLRAPRSAIQTALWFNAPEAWLGGVPARLRIAYQLGIEHWQGEYALTLYIRHAWAA
jgi:single-stranded-DNA-specific exonuclease